MPEQFWNYAEKLASVVSSYIVKEGEEISPFQKLYSHKPNIELIHPFGCYAFAHIPRKNRTKLMPKACPVIYLGPSEKINGYILYDPVKKTIFESSSVVFDEYVFGVSNLLKHIDRGNIPHYFDTYLNEKFIDFSKLSDCDNILSTNTNPMDCVHENPNDSAEIDPHIRGSGYVIIKEGLEVGGGFETIPLGSNNLGEFSGCLAGLQQVIGFGQHVEMVGDCKILTEAAPKTKLIDNFKLNEILSEIRNIAKSKFAKVEYTHVYREFNKRSDVIATAASHSEEDGMEAVFDRNWDPRSKQLATTSEEWIIENSKLWKWVMELLDLDWSFPVKKVQFKRRFKDKVITTNNVYFPVQAALDGVMISPMFISDDIVKWFPERAAPREMLESFVEKENQKWREEYEQARNHWLKSAMRPSIVRKIIRPIKAVEKKRILKEIQMRNRKKH